MLIKDTLEEFLSKINTKNLKLITLLVLVPFTYLTTLGNVQLPQIKKQECGGYSSFEKLIDEFDIHQGVHNKRIPPGIREGLLKRYYKYESTINYNCYRFSPEN